MMQPIWSKPRAEVECFMANEYIAACGDENRVYYFECDARRGNLYYYKNGDGVIDGIYNGNGSATLLGSYQPCGETHEASTTNPFYDGFVDRNGNRRCDSGEAVIVWRGPRNNNGHATAQLDMDSWQTAKS